MIKALRKLSSSTKRETSTEAPPAAESQPQPQPPAESAPPQTAAAALESARSTAAKGLGLAATKIAPEVTPAVEDNFKPAQPLCERDVSLVEAMRRHLMPLLVLDAKAEGLPVAFASSAFIANAGLTGDQVQGATLEKVLLDLMDVKAEDVAKVKEAASKDEDTTLCFKGSKKDGSSLVSLLFLTPLKSPGGEVLYMLAGQALVDSVQEGVADITRNLAYRYRMAQNCRHPGDGLSLFRPYKKLCQADADLIDMLQARKDMFCITDPALFDQPLVFVSDDFVNLTGHPREEIDGINCRFLQGEATNQEDVDVIRRALKEEGHAKVCLLNYRRDKTKFINHFNLSPLRDVNGKLAYFIGVQTDVEDADVYPYPNSRQTLREMLVEEERRHSSLLSNSSNVSDQAA